MEEYRKPEFLLCTWKNQKILTKFYYKKFSLISLLQAIGKPSELYTCLKYTVKYISVLIIYSIF